MTTLTKSEQRLYDALVNTGLTNDELAEYLNLSKYTVRQRMQLILEKIGVSNRTQLVIRHYKEGL